MFRPISLFLIVMLLVASRSATVVGQSDNTWLLLLLFILPFFVVIATGCSKKTRFSPLFATYAILLSWAASLMLFQWGNTVHFYIGDVIVVGDVIILFPAVFWLFILWWVTAPVANRISWALHRFRLDILLLFIPVFLLFGICEAAVLLGAPAGYMDIVEISALVFVLSIAPLIIIHVLSAKQMKNYDLRSSIVEVGQRAGVQQSKVLVWNTHHRIMNALAIGIIFQTKTIVLTDKLIAHLTTKELLAVTAHEFGHHKYWHIPFLIVTMLCAFIWTNKLAIFLGIDTENAFTLVSQLVIMVAAIVLVSRQFERQADSYAAADLSILRGSSVVTPDAAHTIASALGAIAEAQRINVTNNEPMHGSIASRQQQLRSLIGCKIDSIPIYTTVKRIKCLLVILMIVGIFL